MMRSGRWFRIGAATIGALGFSAVTAVPSHAVHQTVTGLTNETPPRIVQFAVGTPGTLINGTPAGITFPMTATDTDLVGIDYRPRGGNLMAVASGGTFYVLAPPATPPGDFTATQVNPTPVAGPFTGTPSDFGFDFNPTVDRVRVVNDAAGGMLSDNNYRFNPDNGTQVDGDGGTVGVQADGDLDYPPADPNAAATPNVVAAAYTNNFDGAPSTTLYDIDSGLDILATQNPPNNGTLNTVGSLGVNTTDVAGFDIEGGTGTAYAALQPMGDAESSFFRLDLTSGATTPNGQIGPDGSPPVESVSLVPTSVLRFANAVTSVAENGGTATVTVYREGPLNRTTTVNYATELAGDDGATSADFTAASGMLTFVPGDAAESFEVPITDDGADEPAETLTVRLSGPNTASNLQSPPTAKIQIVDDDSTPGTLMPLVSAPQQTLRQVLKRKSVRYRYSCNRACDEDTTLLLRATELGSSSSSLDSAGISNAEIALSRKARRALRTAPGRRAVRVKLRSTFTDSGSNEVTIATRLALAR